LQAWTTREIKVRYKQSVLGAAWAILQPVALMVIFSVIFTQFVPVPTGDIPYPIFSYTALLPWTFFAASISFGAASLVNNLSLVTKIYLPREILPLAAIGAAAVDFFVASLVFVVMATFYRVPVGISLVSLPFLLLIQVILTIGVVLLLAALMVRFRDIRFVVPLLIQLWMYATPIIYPVALVPEAWLWLYMLNPMAALIESYRAVILLGQWPQWQYVAVAAVTSIILAVGAYHYFKRSEGVFADVI
jgi:lipopolysaccharide transport system permease protein